MSDTIPFQINSLSVKFGREKIFDNLSLLLRPKEFVTIMGENGSGKTTLINVLMGNKQQHSGSFRFFGIDESIDNLEKRNQKTGWVLSSKEYYPPFLSILDFINALRPHYPTWDRELEDYLVTQFNLDTAKKLNNLSLGEHSKVKLLKAIAFRPELLILDELTANLSDESKKTILSVLIGLFEETKMSILYISHSKEEALKLSDRVFNLTSQGLVEREATHHA